MRIALKLLHRSVKRPPTLIVPEKEPSQPALQLQAHLPQVQAAAGAGRALHLEFVAEEVMELLKRLDDQEVDREPDRTSPVGVAAKQPGLRLRRLIVDLVFSSVEPQRVGMIPMVTGERADPVRREKLRFVQHAGSAQMPIDPGSPATRIF